MLRGLMDASYLSVLFLLHHLLLYIVGIYLCQVVCYLFCRFPYVCSIVIWLLGNLFSHFKIFLWNVVFVVKGSFKRDLVGVAVVRERCQLPWIIG